MEASRELDALVAEKVMGFYLHKRRDEWNDGDPYFYVTYPNFDGHGSDELIHKIPNYSTDISAAWKVIEKVQESCGGIDLKFNRHDRMWETDFLASDNDCLILGCDGAPTVAHAICLAALKAVGYSASEPSEETNA